MRIFDALAATIEATWRETSYDELALPEIAVRALREARIPEQIGADDVLRWLLTTEDLPEQEDLRGMFGEPPITVCRRRRFQVQVIFWVTNTTSIHAHGFTGAFQVLEGSSLQSRYAFHLRRRVNARFMLGDVRLCAAEVLERGDVVAIDRDLAHCVFHLEAPSATIVVRTYVDPDRLPQLEYLPPSLAVDPFYDEPTTRRWLQGLALLIRVKHPEHEALAADILARSDLQTSYLVLAQVYRRLGDPRRAAPLVEVARRRHGDVIDEITAALSTQLLRRKLSLLRADVRDPDQRFFLALLQNLPDRDAIYAMVRRRCPGDEARARVVAWVRALSGVDRIGVDFDDELNGMIFAGLLDGCSAIEIRERLKAEFDPAAVDAQAAALDRHAGRMRQTALAPLFASGA